jgi:hypothetical protein
MAERREYLLALLKQEMQGLRIRGDDRVYRASLGRAHQLGHLLLCSGPKLREV